MSIKRIFIPLIILLLLSSCLTLENRDEQPPEQKSPARVKPEKTDEAAETAAAAETVATSDAERQEALDAHARKAPDKLRKSVQALAAYLAEPCESDMEKARMIFVWIGENIAYDTDAFFYGKKRSQSGESVLASGMAVCAGYSDIFKSLGDSMGLEIISIHGHGKGYSYYRGAEINQNHAWTAVRAEQRWVLIDSTWGAGYVGDDKKYTKKFKDFWFDVDPEIFIFTHLPTDSRYQFTDRQYSTAEYSALPNLNPDLFTGGITPEMIKKTAPKYDPDTFPETVRLLSLYMKAGFSENQFYNLTQTRSAEDLHRLHWEFERYLNIGFSAEALRDEILRPDSSGLPELYSAPGDRNFKSINLPTAAVLKKGEKYILEYIPEDTLRNAVIYNDQWHFALRKDEAPYAFTGEYDGTINAEGIVRFEIDCRIKGSLKIVAQPEEGDSYGAFIGYRIE